MPRFERSKDKVFIVRQAALPDANEIAALANQFGALSGGTGAAIDSNKVALDLLTPNSGLDVLVAECQDRVVAYALHHVSFETSQGAKGRYISDIYVAPTQRRKGIASTLISRIANLAQEEGGEFVWWLDKNETVASRALYAKIADVKQPVTAYAATHTNFCRLSAR